MTTRATPVGSARVNGASDRADGAGDSVTVELVDWDDVDAARLRNAQQAELRARYGHDDIGYSMTGESIVAMLLVCSGGEAVACGALQDASDELGPGVGELKRMYVLPGHRDRGLARLVLTELESLARERGWQRLVLETGVLQPEAIGLYLRSGYELIENFGEYAGEADSRCLAKDLHAPQPTRSTAPARAATAVPRPTVTLRAVPWDDPVAAGLRLAMFTRESAVRYPELQHVMERRGGFEADDAAQGVGTLVTLVAELDGIAVGCATLREPRAGAPGGAPELKKLYVADSARGAGVARALLAAIEDEARARGFTAVVLQTGIRQPEAIGLYLSVGYRVIEPYPPHRGDRVSLCFGKALA